MEDRRYKAFLSYSHRDREVASWLHRALETFHIPARLVGTTTRHGEVPRRLHPVFKDREELPAADSLGDAIDAALAASGALVVLCSPDSKASPWVDKEVARFKQLHGETKVFALLVRGKPGDAFPPSLSVHFRDGMATSEKAEPIAADLNGDGKRLALLKLIAGITGIELDSLIQRDAQRRQKRLATVAAASLVGMVGTSSLAAFALAQRNEARAQRAEADGLIEYMLTDLRKKLEPVGKLDVLDGVGTRALDYYSRQDLNALDANALGRRARAMLLVAEVGDLRGNNAAASQGWREAARSTGELLAREPDDWQRVYDHAQSEFWLAYDANNRGDNKAAMPHFLAYRDLGQRMLELAPDKLESKVEASSGEVNLGIALADERRLEEAIAIFGRAAQRLAAIRPMTREIALNTANAYGHRATRLTLLGRDEESIADRHRQVAILDSRLFPAGDQEVAERKAIIQSQLAGSYLALGKLDEARTNAQSALEQWPALRTGDADNQFKQGEENIARAYLAIASMKKSPGPAEAMLKQAINEQRALVANSVDRTFRSHLLRMAAFASSSGLGWSGWQRALTDDAWEKRSSLNDNERSALAAALISDGDTLAAGDHGAAIERWRRADAILRANSNSTFDALNRGRVERRLNGQPVPRNRHGADRRFAGLLG